MSRRPPKATRPDTLVPDTPLVRSTPPARARGAGGPCPRADGAIAALHSIQAQGSGTDGETSARQDNSRQAPRIQAPRIQTPCIQARPAQAGERRLARSARRLQRGGARPRALDEAHREGRRPARLPALYPDPRPPDPVAGRSPGTARATPPAVR